MICPVCGGQVPTRLSACAECGTAVDAPTGAPIQVQSEFDGAATMLGAGGGVATGGTSAWGVTIGGPPPIPAAPDPRGDTGPLHPGDQFGTRYHIIRLLGMGGMGAVYQAWDRELGLAVAIKVIRPEIMANPATGPEVERRFKRELLLARQVTHKNVVRIHDIGEIDRVKYITMTYVDGLDLATILKIEGRLPVPRVLRIARSVVSGLVAAHAAGVIHRDLKPANIMVGKDDSDTLIMDFGIARSSNAPHEGTAVPASLPERFAQTAAQTIATTAHEGVVGTVDYMAPEQARAMPVDQRADIYAFGLILYDLLLGKKRITDRANALAELKGRMEAAPAPLRSIVEDVPESLDRLIGRCLEPDFEKRYPTTTDLEADLAHLDENGELIPVKRVVGMRMVAAIVVVAAALVGGVSWYERSLIPPAAHAPVSVVIADLRNATGDQTFDRTLEPLLKRGLEEAGFISAYDRGGIRGTLGVTPPETLDEKAARDIASTQGMGVVLSGSIEPQGRGFAVSVKAAETVTGNTIVVETERVSSKEEILTAATRLVGSIRKGLGDEESDSSKLFAQASLSATSLDVMRHYAAGRNAASSGNWDQARDSYARALALDPNFGIGYQALAGASLNLGNVQDAEKYIKEAQRHLDGMTERERYTTRGMSYRMSGDYQGCVKEYDFLIARYPSEVQARNNLALCSTLLRNLPRAVEEVRRVVEMVPKRAFFRINLALYSSYSGDFQAAEREAQAVQDLGSVPWGLFTLAYAQTGQGRVDEAAQTYQALAKTNALGASQSVSGLADLSIVQGRFAEAARILEQGVGADLMAKNVDRAAAKYAALAHARMLRQQKGAAVAAAERALALSQTVKIRFLAARIFVEAGDMKKAQPIIDALSKEVQAEPQAYARILSGEAARAAGDLPRAIKDLTDANSLLDTWIGQFDLGRAQLDAKQYLQADSAFDRAIKRRGEALALFLDEEPTYGFFPEAYYYQGRVRQELNTANFGESFKTYLTLRGESTEDPLEKDARARAGLK